jgi:hypothetical protein
MYAIIESFLLLYICYRYSLSTKYITNSCFPDLTIDEFWVIRLGFQYRIFFILGLVLFGIFHIINRLFITDCNGMKYFLLIRLFENKG